jgi:hypothetical protein
MILSMTICLYCEVQITNLLYSPLLSANVLRFNFQIFSSSARKEKKRGPDRVLVGKSEGRSLERPKRSLEDNIKMDLQEVAWENRLD